VSNPSPATKPFFHADQVGSLLRPQALIDARARFEAGEIGREALRAEEDRAITDAIALQEEVGLEAITDGEFRRQNWWIDFISAIDGVAIGDIEEAARFKEKGAAPSYYAPKIVRTVGKLGRKGPIAADDFRFLKAHTTRTPKVTLPSPTRVHVLGGREAVDRGVYPDMDDFWADLIEVYRDEIADLEELGCRYIQIDDPYLASFVDDGQRAKLAEVHGDLDDLLRLYVDVLNACMAARRPETHLAVHVCRGNARSAWIASGGYEPIAATVFPALGADTLFLEYDDARSGGFAPLRHVPGGVNVALGLVTTKTGELEDKDAIEARIDEAAKIVPLERLALSPQCGFASTFEGNLVTLDDERNKLRLVTDVAREVWGEA
jgi:5-methyltetrahydropteroyltriglutamate--homocysteine methyltransferase